MLTALLHNHALSFFLSFLILIPYIYSLCGIPQWKGVRKVRKEEGGRPPSPPSLPPSIPQHHSFPLPSQNWLRKLLQGKLSSELLNLGDLLSSLKWKVSGLTLLRGLCTLTVPSRLSLHAWAFQPFTTCPNLHFKLPS